MATSRAENLTGKVFGHLTVVSRAENGVTPSGHQYARWYCKCDCGGEKTVAALSLKRGITKSCGCSRTRDFKPRPKRRRYCDYDLSGDYGIGYAHNTGAEFYFDKEDYEKIKHYCWGEHILKGGYHALEAWDVESQSVIRMPWIIVGKNYDHANRNPMDNRKSNLRPASPGENAANHTRQKSNWSGVIGVHWSKLEKKWVATLRKNGKTVFVRSYASFDDAVVARLLAESAFFGEFAPQKHLFQKYGIKGE